jgi:hypothetical protein
MSNHSRWIVLVCLLGMLVGTASANPATPLSLYNPDQGNGFRICFVGPCVVYIVIFQLNIVNYINIFATEMDPLVDPFTYVNDNQQMAYCMTHSCSSTVSAQAIDGNTETMVTYTGTNPILSSYTYPKTGDKGPHFGIVTQGMSKTPVDFKIISEGYDHTSSPSGAISVAGPKPGTKFQIVYANSTDLTTGVQSGSWYEVPYGGGTSANFQFTNYNPSDTIKLSDVGFFISSTEIPLDMLNEKDTGDPNSNKRFTSLPQYDNMSVGPGQTINVTPEPNLVFVMIGSFAGMLGLRHKLHVG